MGKITSRFFRFYDLFALGSKERPGFLVKIWGQPSHHLRFCKYRWNTRESILLKKFVWLRKVKKIDSSQNIKNIFALLYGSAAYSFWSWHIWCLQCSIGKGGCLTSKPSTVKGNLFEIFWFPNIPLRNPKIWDQLSNFGPLHGNVPNLSLCGYM